MTHDEHLPQEDLVLYAMQAMPSHELDALRLHLDRCSECRRVLAEVNGDLALVAMGAEQKVLPQGARQRFINRISADVSRPHQADAAKVTSIETAGLHGAQPCGSVGLPRQRHCSLRSRSSKNFVS